MKHKTSELTGALLDAAVVQALGATAVRYGDGLYVDGASFRPSTAWEHGGPIIDREHINLTGRDRNRNPTADWCAEMGSYPLHFGPTPLIAAMRAYVAHKLGEEVEL
jgi:hypothetical protein